MLWAVFTLIAAAAQTARNAMQRELTASLGTVGATHVRFLFGFPFAILFLIGVMIATGYGWPPIPSVFWPWVVFGAATDKDRVGLQEFLRSTGLINACIEKVQGGRGYARRRTCRRSVARRRKRAARR